MRCCSSQATDNRGEGSGPGSKNHFDAQHLCHMPPLKPLLLCIPLPPPAAAGTRPQQAPYSHSWLTFGISRGGHPSAPAAARAKHGPPTADRSVCWQRHAVPAKASLSNLPTAVRWGVVQSALGGPWPTTLLWHPPCWPKPSRLPPTVKARSWLPPAHPAPPAAPPQGCAPSHYYTHPPDQIFC